MEHNEQSDVVNCSWCGKYPANFYEWHNGIRTNMMALCKRDAQYAKRQNPTLCLVTPESHEAAMQHELQQR